MGKIFIPILAAFFIAPMCFAEMHKFTSSDGSKTLVAEVIAFDSTKQVATLLLDNGRTINSPVTAFKKEDQEYIQKTGSAKEAGKKLAVRFVDEEETLNELKNPLNGYQTLYVKSGYALELRNNGAAEMKGLEADYQIFYKTYLNPFSSRERTDKVIAGKLDIPQLAAQKESSVSTDGIKMTRIRQLPKSQCIGGT
ncbi:MAG: hypothetical protein ACI8UO_005907 [Verrucomicrobiales bacterium]|jgi:hypothetical protein